MWSRPLGHYSLVEDAQRKVRDYETVRSDPCLVFRKALGKKTLKTEKLGLSKILIMLFCEW